MRSRFLAVMAIAMLLSGPAVWAQRTEGDRATAQGPYAVEVPVSNQTEKERSTGFARALSQVLGRMSGDRNASARPGVGQEMRRAGEYVKSYDYRQDEGISPTTGAPTFQTTLIVRFDQPKVEQMASELGLPVWPEPRPKPVLWLAIDDGKGHGPRLVGVQQSDAARGALDRAVQRGYRLGLPSGTAAEQAAAGAIWRGDAAAIARLSARYQPPMQLMGKLYRDAKAGWKADWIFVDGGKILSQWTTEDANARRAMAGGADGAADALVKRYARRGQGAGPAGSYRVVFQGIDSAEEYIRLAGQLQKISVVRSFAPVRASEQGLEVVLNLTTGMAGFRRLADKGVLVAVDGDGDVPAFDVR